MSELQRFVRPADAPRGDRKASLADIACDSDLFRAYLGRLEEAIRCDPEFRDAESLTTRGSFRALITMDSLRLLGDIWVLSGAKFEKEPVNEVLNEECTTNNLARREHARREDDAEFGQVHKEIDRRVQALVALGLVTKTVVRKNYSPLLATRGLNIFMTRFRRDKIKLTIDAYMGEEQLEIERETRSADIS